MAHLTRREIEKTRKKQGIRPANQALILLASGLLPMLVMTVVWFFMEVFPFGANTLMAIDFSQQYIDLFALLRQTVREGEWSNLFYSFSKSIGGPMMGNWGFYLMSPFNLIYILMPLEEFRWAVTLTIWLRYGAMGMSFAYLLIKRYRGLETKAWAVPLFALAYTLSGMIVAYQMNPIFYDVMIMLPLVIVGVEQVLDGGRPFKYTIVLAITLICHFYMGFMVCIFVALYSLYYMTRKVNGATFKAKLQSYFAPIFRLMLWSILGVGLTLGFLLPIVISLLFSKGAYNYPLTFPLEFQIDPLDIVAKFMIGAFDSESWSAGPNLPNVYIGGLALISCIGFFFNKAFKRLEKVGAFTILLVFFISIVHIYFNKLWHMGQSPAGFFYRFSWILSFFMVLLAYRAFKAGIKLDLAGLFFGIAAICLANAIVMRQTYSFLTIWQQVATSLVWLAVLVGFYLAPTYSKAVWLTLAVITIGEFGANAYISQVRMGYANAYTFQDAQHTVMEAIDQIRPGNDEFYRINKTFSRSRNDPMMFDYPGTTHFSSNMEKTTLLLFSRFGDSGSNAATYLGNATPLTDALLGVKYLVDRKPYTAEDQANNPNAYYFGRESTRKDLLNFYQQVGETDRYLIYENQYALPVAFGVNDEFVNLELKDSQAANNQNAIIHALGGNPDELVFQTYAFETVELDNFKLTETETGQKLYDRIDVNQPGTIRFKFTPKSYETYYVTAPMSLKRVKSKIDIKLNGHWYEYQHSFDQPQLWNIADHNENELMVFELSTSTENQIDLTGLNIVRSMSQQILPLIEARQQQGLEVTRWGNDFLEGKVNITDDSTHLFMSIPYDEGWQIEVDGKKVDQQEVWDALMAIPINKGSHEIKMKFVPRGLYIGLGLSLASFITFIVLWWQQRRGQSNKQVVGTIPQEEK